MPLGRGITWAESMEPRMARKGAKPAGMGRLGLRPPAALCASGRSRGGAAVLQGPANPPRERRRKNIRSPFARPKGVSRISRLAFIAENCHVVVPTNVRQPPNV